MLGVKLVELFSVALAPTLICAFYVFIRDKYEREPFQLLLTGLVFGALIIAPIVQTENFVTLFMPMGGQMTEAFYISFFVAGLVEEFFKYIVLFFLIWRNNNFNERFDGIVYSVFISLGFAGVENFLYVYNPTFGGMETGLLRGIFSVPGHALFGVAMGYYFALAKFEPHKRVRLTLLAFIVPWLLHGIYDFILLSEMHFMMIAFVLFVAYLWVDGFQKMKRHLLNSPFKT